MEGRTLERLYGESFKSWRTRRQEGMRQGRLILQTQEHSSWQSTPSGLRRKIQEPWGRFVLACERTC